MEELKFNVIENLASVDGEYGRTIEVNYGKWNNNVAKYDIRAWKSDGKGKGFTLDYDELYSLYSQLHEYYKDQFDFATEDISIKKTIINEDGVIVKFDGLNIEGEKVGLRFLVSNYTDDNRKVFFHEYEMDEDCEEYLLIDEIEDNQREKVMIFNLDINIFDSHEISFEIEIDDEAEEALTVSEKVFIEFDLFDGIFEIEMDNQENEVDEEDDEIIEFKSFLVYTDNFKCQKEGHDISSLTAVVDICTPNGIRRSASFPAIWCEDCNAYYISESTYRELKVQGTILCKVLSKEKFDSPDSVFDTYNEKSILNIYGYNVNAKEDKSDVERRAVLDMIIKNDIMTKSCVIDFLQYLIDRPSGKRNMSQSIRKWRSDIEYLSGKKTQIKAKNIVLEEDYMDIAESVKDDMPF